MNEQIDLDLIIKKRDKMRLECENFNKNTDKMFESMEKEL